MKIRQYTVIFSFIALMAGIVLFSMFKDRDGFSSFENRKLSGPPAISLGSIFDGKFEDGYESYLLDNFLLRDLSVQSYQAYTDMFFLDVFQKSEAVLMEVDVDNFVAARDNSDESGETADGGVSDGTGGPETGGQSQKQQGTETLRPGSDKDKADQNTGKGSPDQGSMDQGSQDQGSPRTSSTSDTGNGMQPNSYSGNQGGGLLGAQSPYGQPNTGSQPAVMTAGEGAGANGLESDEEGSISEGNSDAKLNNSLIISGDRVMMPAGPNRLKAFGDLLTRIAEVLPGKNLYSITGPTSASFYASAKYSTGAYDQSKAEGIIEASSSGVKVVRVYDELGAHRDEDIFFRSDVHWTALGAYHAYTSFCRSAGLTPASLENDFTQGTYEPFLGGLYSQIYKQPQAARLKNNPEKLEYFIPKTGYRLTLYKMGNLRAPYAADSIINTDFDSLGAYKYSCFAWGDQRIESITTDAPGGRSVLVVKDSYGSAFVPFLIPNYSKIYVIDPKGFNTDGALDFDAKTLIRDENIDDIIFCFSIYGSGRSIIQSGLESLFLK
ncbi:MAG TPA: DHHW family protein [Clostridia bacterium]|nr:DHHW family protein [Clostridia bacterium]